MNEAFLINFLKLIYDLVTGMVDGVVPGLLAWNSNLVVPIVLI